MGRIFFCVMFFFKEGGTKQKDYSNQTHAVNLENFRYNFISTLNLHV
jgi:hypothetical protein